MGLAITRHRPARGPPRGPYDVSMKFRRNHSIYWYLCYIALVVCVTIYCNIPWLQYNFAYIWDAMGFEFFERCSVPTDGDYVVHQPITNNSWHKLLHNYQTSRNRNKFVVFEPSRGLGLCNRILNSVSALIFAMATNRSLWIEWNENLPVASSKEIIGMMRYTDFFNGGAALHKPNCQPECYSVEIDPYCITNYMKYGNLDSLAAYDVIKVNRHDFWGSHVMSNRQFKNTVFNELSAREGFPILFRFIFSMKNPNLMRPRKCSWMFQYRTIWSAPYATGPFDNFISCALRFGLKSHDYSSSHVISDNPMAITATSSEATKAILQHMNLPKHKITCRGKCGDEQSMESMYALSECRYAVVPIGSSFGSCIAGLANVHMWIRVGHDGHCELAKHGLVDANCVAKHGCRNTYMLERD